jgi:hypothetical protein
MSSLFKGIGPHNPKYLRGTEIFCGFCIGVVVTALSFKEYDSRNIEFIGYQRWLFPKIDSLFGVSKVDLDSAGYKPRSLQAIDKVSGGIIRPTTIKPGSHSEATYGRK